MYFFYLTGYLESMVLTYKWLKEIERSTVRDLHREVEEIHENTQVKRFPGQTSKTRPPKQKSGPQRS
jgi:hypothetical protein